MRTFFDSLIGYFLTPAGLFFMGALDASLIFFLPFGIDLAVIIVTARNPDLFWLYALLPTMGSLAGATLTFWIGRKVGEHGLTRLMSDAQLQRIRRRVSGRAAVSVAVLGVIPPPFPFKLFILVSAALGANLWIFLTTLAVIRYARFVLEAAFAARYGERIVKWLDSPAFSVTVGVLIVAAIAGTAISAVALYRKTKRGR